MTNVSNGLLARVSDDGGSLYPTVSGLTAWTSEADADKQGSSAGHAFSVPQSLVQDLAAGTGNASLASAGFVMGLVTDGAAGVAGAIVARADGQSMTVLYPDETFSSLVGAATSTSGLFLIPATAGLDQVAIIAAKDAAAYGPALLMPRGGTCFFALLHP